MFNYLKLLLIAYTLLTHTTAIFAVELSDENNKLPSQLAFLLDDNLANNTEAIETTAEEISLKKMGLTHGVTLNGDTLQSGISFTLPYDFIATHAEMQLVLSIDSAENIEKDNLQVTLNDQSLGAIPLSQIGKDEAIFTFKIANTVLSSKNNLNFQIISNDDIINNEWTCQRPDLKNVTLKISPSSIMAMQGILMNTRKSLMDFPRPFLDPLKINKNELAFVYSASPNPDILAASAIVASIFGIKSEEKENHFHVYLDQIPEKHAVLFTTTNEMIAGLSFAHSDGPHLKIIDNPINQKYKILVVSGRNAEELRQAAYQLFTEDLPDGDSDHLHVPAYRSKNRLAYDAPNWLPLKKSIPFSQIMKTNDALQSRLFLLEEKNITFQVPPDTFMLTGNKIPVQINYSFDKKNWVDMNNSILTIALNYQFLKNISAHKNSVITAITDFFGHNQKNSTMLYLDNSGLIGENKLSFYFNIKTDENIACDIINNASFVNQILTNSTIDLSDASHFGELPNTHWFLNGLFPYTKYADLSDTVLLLNRQPEKEDIVLMLQLMEKSGRITGFPVSHLTILSDTQKSHSKLKNSNIIVIAKIKDIPAVTSLMKGTSYHYSNGNLNIISPSLFKKVKLLLLGEWKNQFEIVSDFLSNTHQWRGILSFQSPWSSNKVVTNLTATNTEQLNKLYNDIKKSERQPLDAGDILLFSDADSIKNLSINPSFLSGELPPHRLVLWFFSQHLFLLMVILFSSLLFISFYLYNKFKQHESKRLTKVKREYES
ncbi:cellulose biosynthesis cyclic di-GMP-binding regulatory protein BcsB [Providencia sp. 21OH12SH02B-Prov]|uniref:cellulose biosynthesis cyclic di-GMP-binding regulatory protein BcsB n=1 Tax=Providencia sp. 21OH12SH02B-Prov TaxID=3015951 RepID=UPI0022B6874E|nr:cellulose biosynthesis cyclic di-GMP-binding regulatory protein BcsB [Providencia sp. 21OH12SH02B-Prov]WBA56361.1 cellulose biosynthesis cyclic di-GMP-binding regulatory protein BcsB [Providencia sp. 21OH12SH02B-Prov]